MYRTDWSVHIQIYCKRLIIVPGKQGASYSMASSLCFDMMVLYQRFELEQIHLFFEKKLSMSACCLEISKFLLYLLSYNFYCSSLQKILPNNRFCHKLKDQHPLPVWKILDPPLSTTEKLTNNICLQIFQQEFRRIVCLSVCLHGRTDGHFTNLLNTRISTLISEQFI